MLSKKGRVYLLITLLIPTLSHTLAQSEYWARMSGLDSAKVYSISFNQIGQPIVGTANQGSIISTDGGNSWTKVCDYSFFCVKKGGSLMAGTEGHGIVSSGDSGRTWIPTADSLGNVYSLFDFQFEQNEYPWVTRYSIVGSDSNIAPWPAFSITGPPFLAGTYGGGVYFGPESWVPVNEGLTNLYVHSVVLNYSLGLLFAATDNGVFRATNADWHWSKLNTQWTSKTYCLVLNRRNWLYAGTGTGVFCSRDQGESWVETSSGLNNRDVSALAVGPDGHVWVGTWGGGVYRSIENTDRPPHISCFEPLSAPPGSELTIRGENFLGTSTSNFVYVGGERAEIQSMSESVIKVLVPYGSAYGNIVVVSSGLSSSSTSKFTPSTPSICVLDSLSFSPPLQVFTSTTAVKKSYVFPFDVDQDQRPDLLVGVGRLLLNKSSTGTIDYSSSEVRLCAYGTPSIGVCDMDADGRLDFFLSESDPPQYTRRLLNRTINNIVDFSGTSQRFSFVYVIGSTDFDLDGRPDIFASGVPSLQVIENRFDGFLYSSSRWFTFDNKYGEPQPVDLNGDQNQEIIGVEGGSTLVIFKNESRPGTFAFRSVARYPLQGTWPKLRTGDIDGDGRADMLLLTVGAAPSGSNISIFPNRSTVDSILVGDRLDFVADGSPSNIELADADGDGRVDLVLTNEDSNSVEIVLNASRPGEYSFGRRIWIKLPKSPKQVQVIDLDADGKPDMAIAYPDGSVAISRNISPPMPTQVPSAVQLEYPVDGSVVLSDSVYIRWHPASPAVAKYWLESATDSLFVNRLVDSAVTDTGYTLRGLRSGQTCWWKVKGYNAVGWGPFSDVRRFFVMTTDVSVTDGVPMEFTLRQNYPNPFNPSTTITFELPGAAHVSLKVYDVLGREVSVLVNERRDAGVHEVKFDGAGQSSGVYFYRLHAGDFVATKRLLLMK